MCYIPSTQPNTNLTHTHTHTLCAHLPSFSLSRTHPMSFSKAELEGHPDILLTLVSPPDSPPLDHLITHSCVQSADVTPASPRGTDQRNRKIRFSAPNESFTLCNYQVSGIPVVPIRGFYQMKVYTYIQLQCIQLQCVYIVCLWKDILCTFSSYQLTM